MTSYKASSGATPTVGVTTSGGCGWHWGCLGRGVMVTGVTPTVGGAAGSG